MRAIDARVSTKTKLVWLISKKAEIVTANGRSFDIIYRCSWLQTVVLMSKMAVATENSGLQWVGAINTSPLSESTEKKLSSCFLFL